MTRPSRLRILVVLAVVSAVAIGSYYAYRDHQRRELARQIDELREYAATDLKKLELRLDQNHTSHSDLAAKIPDLILIRALCTAKDRSAEDRWGKSSPSARADELLHAIDPNWPQRPEARSMIVPLWLWLGRWPIIESEQPRNAGVEEVLRLIDPDWRSSGEVRAAIPDRVAQLTSPEKQNHAERSLELITPEWARLPEVLAATPALMELLLQDDETSWRAERVLERLHNRWWLRDDAKALIPELTKRLTSPDPVHRDRALFRLEKIGNPPRTAIPFLVLLLAEDSRGGRKNQAAEILLSRIHPNWADTPEARSAIPTLVERYTADRQGPLWQQDWHRPIWAVLERFGAAWPTWPEGRTAKTRLLAGLDGEFVVAANCAWALGQMAPDAAAAVPKLTALLAK